MSTSSQYIHPSAAAAGARSIHQEGELGVEPSLATLLLHADEVSLIESSLRKDKIL